MKKENVKKRIGLDLDGVLADHAKNAEKTARKLGLKKNSEEVKEIIYRKLSLTAGVVKGAKRGVKSIGKDFDLFVVSRRGRGSRYGRMWLKKHFDFPEKSVFFVDADKGKAAIIKKLGLDFFIDDKMSVLLNVRGKTKKFLLDTAGSYKKERYGGIKVVHSFDDFLKELQSGGKSGNLR